MTGWETRGSRVVYENPWIVVREDDVTRPDGSAGIYGVTSVRHPAVFVVAVTDGGEVALVRLFRYATGRWSVEVPGGGSDGEDPLVAGPRELLEETGLTATGWQLLQRQHAFTGVAYAPADVLLATGASGDLRTDDAEGITAVLLRPWPVVFAMIRSGEIDDSESIGALTLAALALGVIGTA